MKDSFTGKWIRIKKLFLILIFHNTFTTSKKIFYQCTDHKFLKISISILLIFIILLQPFSKMAIIMDYHLRKDFISKVLCVNRNKPQMHCDGKCYLAKKLKLEEEKESKTRQGNLKEKSEQIIVNQPIDFSGFQKKYWILNKKSDLFIFLFITVLHCFLFFIHRSLLHNFLIKRVLTV